METDSPGSHVRLAHNANVLSKEALAFFWALSYCDKHNQVPSLQKVREGVEKEYGETLTRPTAGRGLCKARARALLLRRE